MGLKKAQRGCRQLMPMPRMHRELICCVRQAVHMRQDKEEPGAESGGYFGKLEQALPNNPVSCSGEAAHDLTKVFMVEEALDLLQTDNRTLTTLRTSATCGRRLQSSQLTPPDLPAELHGWQGGDMARMCGGRKVQLRCHHASSGIEARRKAGWSCSSWAKSEGPRMT